MFNMSHCDKNTGIIVIEDNEIITFNSVVINYNLSDVAVSGVQAVIIRYQ